MERAPHPNRPAEAQAIVAANGWDYDETIIRLIRYFELAYGEAWQDAVTAHFAAAVDGDPAA
jgi:hypothetical protein